jgi:LPXTG-motif cell wall-anchored protein
MKLRQMPPGLLKKTATGTTAIGLPQTATPATLKALIGLGLLLTGIVLVLVFRRRAPAGVAGV